MVGDVAQRHAIHTGRSVVLQHQVPCRQQHVEPIDPVVQGVEPELRLLLGLLAQLPSQLRDFRGQRDSTFHLRFRRWGGASGLLFRSGTLVQAGLLAFDSCMISAGSLRSAVVSGVNATMNPSDSHTSRTAVMHSRHTLAARRARDAGRSRGSLRFLFDLSASAVPNHPGEFVPLRLLVASRTMTGFTTFGRLATLALRNEAESGSLTLRLMPSLPQAPTPKSPWNAAGSATWRTSTYHVQFLSTEKTKSDFPDTPKALRRKESPLRLSAFA